MSRCVAGIALSSSSHLAQKKSVASFVFCSVEVLVCSDQTWSDVVIVSTLQVLVLDLILVNTRRSCHLVWMTAGHDGRQRFNSLRLQSLQEILENNKDFLLKPPTSSVHNDGFEPRCPKVINFFNFRYQTPSCFSLFLLSPPPGHFSHLLCLWNSDFLIFVLITCCVEQPDCDRRQLLTQKLFSLQRNIQSSWIMQEDDSRRTTSLFIAFLTSKTNYSQRISHFYISQCTFSLWNIYLN